MVKKKTVYLVKCENLYKIGFTSKKVIKRLKELQVGNGNEFVLVKEFQSEFASKLESTLHRIFNSKHKSGEWYELTDEDVESFDFECNKFETAMKYLELYNPFIQSLKK